MSVSKVFTRLNSNLASASTIGAYNAAPFLHPEPKLEFRKTVDLKSRTFNPTTSLFSKAPYLPKEPIVFLHGIFGNSRMYSKQSQQIANNLQTPVISVDIRNHGLSPRASPMDYATLVEDVEKFVLDHKLGKINIQGFSMGAKIAMLYALRNPDQVARTVVIDNSPVEQNDIQGFLMDFAEGLIRIIDEAKIKSSENDWYEKANEVLKAVVPDPLARNYLMATNLKRGDKKSNNGYVHLILPVKYFKDAIRNEVGRWPSEYVQGAKFEKPTLFLRALYSPFIRKSHVPVIESYFPHFEVERIHSSHLIPDERPDLMVNKITNWFKQHPSN